MEKTRCHEEVHSWCYGVTAIDATSHVFLFSLQGGIQRYLTNTSAALQMKGSRHRLCRGVELCSLFHLTLGVAAAWRYRRAVNVGGVLIISLLKVAWVQTRLTEVRMETYCRNELVALQALQSYIRRLCQRQPYPFHHSGDCLADARCGHEAPHREVKLSNLMCR